MAPMPPCTALAPLCLTLDRSPFQHDMCTLTCDHHVTWCSGSCSLPVHSQCTTHGCQWYLEAFQHAYSLQT